MTPDRASFSVPVRGSLGRGSLLFQASKGEADRDLVLRRCELEVEETEAMLPEQFRGKTLVVFDEARHGRITEYCPTYKELIEANKKD